jgi:hypothetical protein
MVLMLFYSKESPDPGGGMGKYDPGEVEDT